MEWIEITVNVDPELAEAVSEVLCRYIPQGVAIELGDGEPLETVAVRAYLAVDEEIEERRRAIEEALWHLSQIRPFPEPTFRTIADQDWTAGFKETIPVIHIGRRIVIRPSWREYLPQEGEIVIELDPGIAFGTGLHPTTQLCLEAVEDLVRPGQRVLDMGTGTGILAIAAARLGAAEIVAVDNDPNAMVATRHNARNNQVDDRVRPVHGSLAETSGSYDLVLANILAPVLLSMIADGLTSRVKRTGALVLSGILEEQAQSVREALHAAGMMHIEQRQQGDWVALIARWSAPDAPVSG